MPLSSISSKQGKEGAPRWRYLLLGLALLFVSLPLVLHTARAPLREAQILLAQQKAKSCASERGPEACYAGILKFLKTRMDYRDLAKVCTATGDPACYRAYGQVVSNPSLCAYVGKDGLPALHACYLGGYGRR